MDGDQVLLLHLGLDGVIDGVGAEVDRAADEGRCRLRTAALDIQNLDVEPLLGKEALGFGQHGRQIHHETNPTDPDPLERNYYGLEIGARKRMADRWQFDGNLISGFRAGSF